MHIEVDYMKTLYESILSSTKSGKKALELTVDYLKSLGWFDSYVLLNSLYSPRDLVKGAPKGQYGLTFKKEGYFTTDIFDKENKYECTIENKEDYDNLIEFWRTNGHILYTPKYNKALKKFFDKLGKNKYKKVRW